MIVRRITYTDAKGGITDIEWYKSLEETVDSHHEFCGGEVPLEFRWYGERYDNVKPSVATIQVLIKNQADAAIMEEQLNGGFYIRVLKNKAVFWVGKVWPQYFTEPYRQFPYTIQFSASDQLGQMKDYQPLMVDFPVPHNKWKLIDFLNRFLTEPTFKPACTLETAPSILRVSTRIHVGTSQDLVESIYLDPRCFMAFGTELDEYDSKMDMLNSIFKPLHLKLFQWDGKWHLISLDAQWDAGKLPYNDYTLDYTLGATSIGGGTLDQGILDLYDPLQQNISDPDDHEVFENAVMEYLPVWGQFTMKRNFQKNTELLPFANRNGNFYYGDGLTALELNWGTPNPNRKELTHWTPNPNGTELGEDEYPPVNSGRIVYPTKLASDENKVSYIINIPPVDYEFINLSAFITANQAFYVAQRMVFKLTDGDGNTWWLENDNYDHNTYDPNIRNMWRDYFVSYYMPVDKQNVQGFKFETTVDHPSNPLLGLGTTLEVWIYRPSDIGLSETLDPIMVTLNALRVDLSDLGWDNTNFRFDSTVEVSMLGTEPPFDIGFKWGITHPYLVDNWFYHLSSPYGATGNVINAFLKDGSAGDPPDYRILTDWLILNFFDDNSTYTPQLSGSYRSIHANPLRLVKDYEGKIYDFTSGTYNDKIATWDTVYTQYKALRNVPGIPVKGDYSTVEYNDDYYK